VKPIVFGQPVLDDEAIAEVVACLRSGWIGPGPRVASFERALETYVGAPHVRCVSSCTAALTLGLLALGIGAGDEVVVPAMTFVATANAVAQTGAEVVLVDCMPETGLIDLDAAHAALTPRTRAIVVVHLAGVPADLDAAARLAERHGLAVVEDAAHALGAAWRGTKIGGHGNLCAFSFSAGKNLTTIEGGALATADAAVADEVARLASQGMSATAWQRSGQPDVTHYDVHRPGFKHAMTDVQAALGVRQLPLLERWIAARAEHCEHYDALLEGLPLELPARAPADAALAHHLYRVAVTPDARLGRDALAGALRQAGIGVGIHYRAVHLHPYYAQRGGLAPSDLPVCADASARTLSLPLSHALTASDRERVAGALRSALSGRR
jgi:dTDP-4-amino-4,6-dideoxygalactose transaminase